MAETVHITADILADNRLFEGLSSEALERLAAELPTESALPGQVLMEQDAEESHMFVVLQGELEVLHRGDADRDVTVALLGPGDWAGEMAVLEVQPRSASVRALSPSLLIRITASDVERLLLAPDPTQYATVVLNIARELSRRLRVADRVIANASTSLAERYVKESRRPPAR
ncbi:MAG: cyclic nucleotide-binding domain-containing protein [Myxococcales bacterium]|jgi:CRP-like cAMP-binding protein